MTLVKRGKYWHYDFWYRGRRYQRTTEQERREDAEQVERDVKRRLRQERHGIAPLDREQTPSFSAWAETCLAQKARRLRRPDLLERTLRMVLAFWGRKPRRTPAVVGGVYHDLRLADPILDPTWIERFEDWMDARGISGSTKNSYRSALSGMYKLALKPRFRTRTNVTSNPFEDIERDSTRRRRLRISAEDVRAWISHAAPHAVLAMTIGALAPKLRLEQVLALRFDKHLNRDLTLITFDEYKSVSHRDGEPQITAVADDLRVVLEAVRRARPSSKYVVTFRGRPVTSIKRATATAARRAGLQWGIKNAGVTFHALRHAFATEAARVGINELLASRVLDHADPRTTRKHYTHLYAEDERAALNRMAEHFGLKQIALRAVGKNAGTRPMTRDDLERIRKRAKRFKRTA